MPDKYPVGLVVGPAPYAKVRGASEQCIACGLLGRQRLSSEWFSALRAAHYFCPIIGSTYRLTTPPMGNPP